MKKHYEGKYHKNKELANKYEKELLERQIQEDQMIQRDQEENL
jgi:hypothetical protein